MMQVHISAEESNTTAENPDQQVKEYYEGLFGMVAGLNDELTEFADTHLYVLSEEYGVASGDDLVLITKGDLAGVRGGTNAMKVVRVNEIL
jgi:pyruvate kinase